MDDVWEVDPQEWTLDDIEIIEAALTGRFNAGRIKQALGRLVTNKTPEDIGKYTMRELNAHGERLMTLLEELSVPKENATP